MRNRSIKLIPANWREYLATVVFTWCDNPPRHFTAGGAPQRKIPRPGVHIAFGSLPTGMIEFTLDRDSSTAYWQHRAIDWALSLCDVKGWPVPKAKSRIGKSGECFVNTGLYLSDRHTFSPSRLEGVEGIDSHHLEQYLARRGKAELLGIKTVCGEPCPCRSNLPKLWQLGWEMHY